MKCDLNSVPKTPPEVKLSVIVIPRINDYKYLRCLYKEVLNLSNAKKTNMYLYSPSSKSTAMNRLFYPFEILLLLRRKSGVHEKTVLHLHWIEFLYRWGENKFLIPFLTPLIIAFFRFFKKIYKTKLVVTAHNVLPHKLYLLRIEYHFFRVMLQELSDCVFVHSALSKDLLVKFYGVSEKKVYVIKHGFLSSPQLSNQVKKLNRTKLGVSSDDLVFSFIGTISEYKGVSVLLDAIKELFTNKTDLKIRVILAGEASKTYLRYLHKKYNDILNDERVTFLNKRLSEKELDRILSATDFGICPYIKATTPASLLDFVRYRLPIVTTDDPNVLDMLKDYPLIIVKRGDSLSLAQAIYSAYSNASRQELETDASECIATYTDAWVNSANLSLSLYLSLVGG
jgi:glycosyltransferase involved in cell wall biosynthesis